MNRGCHSMGNRQNQLHHNVHYRFMALWLRTLIKCPLTGKRERDLCHGLKLIEETRWILLQHCLFKCASPWSVLIADIIYKNNVGHLRRMAVISQQRMIIIMRHNRRYKMRNNTVRINADGKAFKSRCNKWQLLILLLLPLLVTAIN